MRADELDVRARLRAHCRALIADCRRLGVHESQIQAVVRFRGSAVVLELETLKHRALRRLSETPKEAA